jgi:RecA/RadA recombinase
MMAEKKNELIKKYGKRAFISGQELVDTKSEIIPISPALDVITGGIPGGSVVILSGKPKCGKTITALHIGTNAQELGRKVFYHNVEHRLKSRDLLGIPKLKLDIDNFEVIESYRDEDTGETTVLTADDHLEIAEYNMHNTPRCVLIFDSVSMFVTNKERTANVDDQHYAPGAKLLSMFLKRMTSIIGINDLVIIAILHISASMQKMGKKTVRTGGFKIQYAVDVDLDCKTFTRFKNQNDVVIGQTVSWETGSTASSIAPGQKMDSIIRYGMGIDEIAELVTLGTATGFISSPEKSAWYTLEYLDKPLKLQGKDKVRQHFLDHPDDLNKLRTEVIKMLRP